MKYRNRIFSLSCVFSVVFLFIAKASGFGFNLGAFWKRATSPLGTFSITGTTGFADSIADAWLVNAANPTIVFGSSANATSYDIVLKDSADTSIVCQKIGATSTTQAIAGCSLSDKTTYKIHITAIQGSNTLAATNEPFSFTTDYTTPTVNTITGITGASDSTVDTWLTGGLLPTVNWNAFANASSYDVTIKNSAGSSVVCTLQNTTAASSAFSSCPLVDATDYRAYVTAKSPSGFNTINASNTGFLFSVDNTTPGTFNITGITGGTDAVIDAYLANGLAPTVNYGASASAYRFDVVIKDSTGSSTICSSLNQTGSPTSVTCTLTNGVTYKAYVTAKSTSGFNTRAASNDGFSFVVGSPVSSAPSDFIITGATGGTDTTADSWLTSGTIVTANWQAAAGATSYDVTIRNSSDTTTVCATQNTASTSYTFSGCTLTVGTTYLIKVDAKNSLTTSALNTGIGFTVLTAAPGAFTISGASGGTDVTYDAYLMNGNIVTVGWTASSGASSYDVTIRNLGDTADICTVQNTASTSYTFSGCTLTLGTSYNIKVVAKSGSQSTFATNSLFPFYVANSVNFCPTGTSNAKALNIYDSGGSAGNYSNNEGCNFLISPPATPYRIVLNFTGLGLASNDKLSVYDGTSAAGILLGQYPDGTTAPFSLTASSPNIYMFFSSTPIVVSTGYAMSYRTFYRFPTIFNITGITGGSDATIDAFLTDSASGVTVAWGASTNVVSYTVSIRNSANTNDICGPISTVGTSYNFSSCSLVLGASYIATVVAKNTNGDITSAGNNPYAFTYTNKPLGFVITGVTGGTDATSDSYLENGLAPTLNWTASALQTSYDVTIYESDGFAVKCPKVNVAAGSTSYAFSTCNLTSGSTYIAEVIAKNGNGVTAATNNFMRFGVFSPWTPTSLVSQPLGRSGHASVWTGSEMIVWGGTDSVGNMLNTGGKYNPTTDSWIATTIDPNTPLPRTGPESAWSGTEMIIWGGYDQASFNYFSTGGRYNPSSNSWSNSALALNAGREAHTAVWTGSEMIVWGGASDGGLTTNTGRRYDPSTDSWTATSVGANLPGPRRGHTAVWTGSEMIVWGGTDSTGVMYYNTGAKYNPTTDSWSATSMGANVPAGRMSHTAVWTGTEMIVWGGQTDTFVNTGAKYNPSSDTWTATSTGANVPTERANHTAIWTGSQMVVWGGSGLGGVYPTLGGRYNPSTDVWSAMTTSSVPVGREGHTAVWTGTEMIVWGGWPGSGNMLTSGGKYNPMTDKWAVTSVTGVPAARYYHRAIWTGSQMIVWGGQGNGLVDLNSGAKYTPGTDTWVATSTGTDTPSARSSNSMVWTGTEMIVYGGKGHLNDGGRYTPGTDSWIRISIGDNVLPGRTGTASVWTGTELVIWAGNDGVDRSDGAKYNPSTETWTQMSLGPLTSRYNHTAVWTGSKVIFWGGMFFGSPTSEGGAYDPATDTWDMFRISATGAPSGRFAHSAIWTGTEMIIWGGSDAAGFASTGGRYNPSTDAWSSMASGTARDSHTAIWTGSQMIVWGGKDSGGALNTGGVYSPSTNTWVTTPIGTNTPTARYGHRAVWTGTKMIIWGGISGLDTGGVYSVP